ncbi:la-related protein 7 [Sinocyclocheilus rhinocerous]|uniref:la-related protein 7 n=1 Tax=Sinocyclocheilus rhinocerous TaxID=307959 RepID=UPI0007B906B3|nr:PREDICTED: la-related protein 7 [Sinocyclocheilus rhinocerous]XP_016428371.1 PREDICTED: la-related protein 7 [Sinocyclocheilus rhinocerous]XP_016428372.1 PREDICTED: la-related protein 7 [Sinocyclocheilus rhinocerous]XP_016428373.1 PREDICTED: la-related protein 7 [Sinocyclocheilus rhinocerous]
MIDTEKISSGGDAARSNQSEKKENEKKKRSRVKQLLAEVKKQVEFWFGDVNLHKDRFMKNVIEQSRDGYVDISVLTSFNRMKKLTTDVKLIARALKNSAIVEVNLQGTHVRRKDPLGESPKDVDNRTVYVELLPKSVTHVWLERVFSKCGNVVYVSIPRYKSTGHPKGFAFVEFETEEQAQKAIEMLNNPPEDAPKKPGIFPKTCKKKTIHFEAIQDTQGYEENGKKKKKKRSRNDLKNSACEEMTVNEMDREGMLGTAVTNEPKKQSSDESKMENPAILISSASKNVEKKRRRSRSSEALVGEAQDEMPSKIRKVEEEEYDESEMKDLSTESKNEEQLDSEKKDDSVLKAKRKRKKKLKERLKIGEEVIPLRVLSKKEWLNLKQEYLTLQKHCMAHLKQSVAQINQKSVKYDIMQTKENENTSCKDTAKKEPPSGPEFASGVIVKISYNQPLPSKRCIKDSLSEMSAVAYVDILDGDKEGYIRFKSPEDAQTVITAQSELQKKYNWNLELLSGDREQRYWQKILVDRQAKLNSPREKKRGTEKLISKAEKIIIARATEASKHIRFDD